MIWPVQRIPRYQIFLKDLIKHSYPGNKPFQDYTECIEKVKETLSAINSQMKGSERFIKPSINLEKVIVKDDSINLINKNLLAEFEMRLIYNGIKPSNKAKYKIMVFWNTIVILK